VNDRHFIAMMLQAALGRPHETSSL